MKWIHIWGFRSLLWPDVSCLCGVFPAFVIRLESLSSQGERIYKPWGSISQCVGRAGCQHNTQTWLEREMKGEEKEEKVRGKPSPPWIRSWQVNHSPSHRSWAAVPSEGLPTLSPAGWHGSHLVAAGTQHGGVVKLQAPWVQVPGPAPPSCKAMGPLAHLSYLSFSISKMGAIKNTGLLGLLGGLNKEI